MSIAKSVLMWLLVFALAMSLNGCSSDTTKQVAATVNGVDIYEGDVSARLESIRAGSSSEEDGPLDDAAWAKMLKTNGYTPETIREYIIRNQFALHILIVQKAAEQGITPDAGTVNQSISDAKAAAETAGKTWTDYLLAQGFASEDSFRRQLESQNVLQELLDTSLGDSTPSQADIDKYLSENAARYAGKRFSLIYLPFTTTAGSAEGGGDGNGGGDTGNAAGAGGNEANASGDTTGAANAGSDAANTADASGGSDTPNAADAAGTTNPDTASAANDENSQENVLPKAQEALGKIRGGTDFSTVASEYSKDANTAQKGGDYGWGAEVYLPDEVKMALDGLGANEVSGIIESSTAYYLIQCTEIFTLPEPVAAAEGAAEEAAAAEVTGTEGAEGADAALAGDANTGADTATQTVDASLVPASLVEQITKDYIERAINEAQQAFVNGLVASDEITIKPMPKGLPYDVDMTLADK